MKRPFPSLFAVVGALTALTFLAGCAGTDTRRSSTEYFEDRAVAVRVENALQQEDQTRELELSTTTVDGVVQLSGSVDNPEQRYRAEEIAEGVPGVNSVINNINIGSGETLYGARDSEEEEAEAEEQSRADEELEPDVEADPTLESELPDMEEQDPEAATSSPTQD